MTGNDTEYFVKQLLATVEANDLSRLKGLLDHFNQSTYQTKLCNGFAHDSLDKALALGHYEIAQELFKHGMNWTYTTMDAVMDGGNESNDWNTKAIDVALANGWDINEHYDQVGNALV